MNFRISKVSLTKCLVVAFAMGSSISCEQTDYISIYKYAGNATPEGCSPAAPVAVLAFDENIDVYLNLVDETVLDRQHKHALAPFEHSRNHLVNAQNLCVDDVQLLQTVRADFNHLDYEIDMHIFRARNCENGATKLYVILPDGSVIAPVKSTYDLITSQCVLPKSLSIL
jgi:hypothetical protein